MNQSAVQSPINFTPSSSVILLENLINPDDKICLLKKRINWDYLNNKFNHLFNHEQAPPAQLILGLLYLQSIDDLPYSDIIDIWEKSPEWQYFCGEKFLSDTFPMANASLSIWSRAIGDEGRIPMMRALGAITHNETLH